MFPERWFDLVLVLTAETHVLFDRLTQRGYSQRKIQENVECEIMRVIEESAVDNYDKNIVHVLPSNTVEELESNVDRIIAWYDAYRL
jgi:adenylate kinase